MADLYFILLIYMLFCLSTDFFTFWLFMLFRVCVCVLQFHKYYIQAEVLQESWPLDESLSSFIQKLRDIERSEMRGTANLTLDTTIPTKQLFFPGC